jgi:hypothetical protein
MALENDQEYVIDAEDDDYRHNCPDCEELPAPDADAREEEGDAGFHESARCDVEDLVAPPPLSIVNILEPISQSLVQGSLPS